MLLLYFSANRGWVSFYKELWILPAAGLGIFFGFGILFLADALHLVNIRQWLF